MKLLGHMLAPINKVRKVNITKVGANQASKDSD